MPEAHRIASSHFTPAVARSIVAAGATELRERFFRIWTRKEAVIKAIGSGLSTPLTEFEVGSAERQESWQLVHLPARTDAIWALRDLRPTDGYVAALAVLGAATEVSFWSADID